MEASLW